MKIVSLLLLFGGVVIAECRAAPKVSSLRPIRGLFLSQNKIVGGEPIGIEDAPYQVSLQQSSSHVCGGTIVADRYVVTAAHCVAGSGLRVRVGSDRLTSGGTYYTVERIYTHPNYSDLDYDIAVIKLNKSIEFGNSVAKINLVQSGLAIKEGSPVDVVGWGVTQEGEWFLSERLRRVTVPALSQETCTRKYRGVVDITSRMICAGTDAGGKDSCQGDSGGGLTYNGTLAGVVSFGLGCARPGVPGVYSRVATLRPWLEQIINS